MSLVNLSRFDREACPIRLWLRYSSATPGHFGMHRPIFWGARIMTKRDRLSIAAIVAMALLSGCVGSSDPCAGDLEPAVMAFISDSATGAPLAYRSSLVIRDGSYSDSVAFDEPQRDSARVSLLVAGKNREGTYSVTVRRAGARTWTRENVKASRDRCGDLVAVRLTVRLQPAPTS
jgi:hypothetical protein